MKHDRIGCRRQHPKKAEIVNAEERRNRKNRRKRAGSSAQPTTRWSQRDLPTARDRTTSPRGLEHASTACWTDKVGGV